MALSKDDILNAIAAMTVMDVVDLIKAMEEKFGVSAARRISIATRAKWLWQDNNIAHVGRV